MGQDRFPHPAALAQKFAHSGMRLVANVKPAMLLSDPRFAEVEGFHDFIRDSEDESPRTSRNSGAGRPLISISRTRRHPPGGKPR